MFSTDLCDGVIRCHDSLQSFQSTDAHSNMCRLDHRDIVGTVSVMTWIPRTYLLIYLLLYSLFSLRLHREPFLSLLFHRAWMEGRGGAAQRAGKNKKAASCAEIARPQARRTQKGRKLEQSRSTNEESKATTEESNKEEEARSGRRRGPAVSARDDERRMARAEEGREGASG
jgi:hypothetical protein